MAATGRTVMMPSEDEAGKKGYLSTVKHMHSRDRLRRLLCAAAAATYGFPMMPTGARENVRTARRVAARCCKPGTSGRARMRRGAATSRCCSGRERTAARGTSGRARTRRGAAISRCCEWARENDCPWDEETCAYAARGGHLDVLKWARENGCPWNEWTCTEARWGDQLNVLKWARANWLPVGHGRARSRCWAATSMC